jgi:hypothetical protein
MGMLSIASWMWSIDSSSRAAGSDMATCSPGERVSRRMALSWAFKIAWAKYRFGYGSRLAS